MIDILFVAALLLATYPHGIYVGLLYLVTRRRPDPSPLRGVHRPTVTVVLSAHNEAAVIDERIRNLESLEYPRHLIDVLIGSDGSSDATVALARRAADASPLRIAVVEFPARRGKAAVIDDLVERARGAIVVLSDANTAFAPDAVARLVRWFADPATGGVVGRLDLVAADRAGTPEQLYWRLETRLKRWENRLGAVLGANGAIYALRRTAYVPAGNGIITDDFVLPLLVRQRGFRIVFDPEASAREATAHTVRHEFRRRLRIAAGNMQALWLTRALLHPRAGWTAFSYWSHKVLRWLSPFFWTIAVACAISRWRHPLYGTLVAAVAVVLGIAGVGWLRERLGRPVHGVVAAAYAAVALNLALAVGAVRFFLDRGSATGHWEHTPRTAD